MKCCVRCEELQLGIKQKSQLYRPTLTQANEPWPNAEQKMQRFAYN